MNTDANPRDGGGGLFAQHPRLRELERQLYGHVHDTIDWEALSRLEWSLIHALVHDLGLAESLALDLSGAMMRHALQEVADDDSSRFTDVGPPPGITEAEAKAVAFDETCPFCLAGRAASAERDGRGGEHEEECPCCEDLAASWREEHRAVLVEAGLWKQDGKPS